MLPKVLDAVTVTLKDVAGWLEVSHHTVRAWRLGNRTPDSVKQRQLAAALRKHARQLQRFADQLERHAGRDR